MAVLSDTALPVWEQTGLTAADPVLRRPQQPDRLPRPPGRNPGRPGRQPGAAVRGVRPRRLARGQAAGGGARGSRLEEWPLPADWHGPRRWADRVAFRAGRYLVLAMPAADVPAWMADVTDM